MAKDDKKKNKIRELMAASMEDLSGLTNVDAVVGKPVTTPDGTTVIPVCKVTVGYMTGGGEYGDAKTIKAGNQNPFAGGSGAVVSMKPVGFLTSGIGGVKLISAEKTVYEKLFDSVEQFIDKIKK